MPNDATGSGASTQSRSVGQRLQRGFESKVLVPLATTVVSAAASYLLRKLPMIIEERVLPKLREQGGANAVRDTVATVAEQAAAVVPGLGAKEAGDGSPAAEPAGEDGDGASPSSSRGQRLSMKERESERREREERRNERRRAVQRT